MGSGVVAALATLVAVLAVAAILLAAALVRSRRNQRRYRSLLEGLPETSVVLFDRELRFRLVAGSAPRAGGVDAEDIEGKHLREIVPEAQAELLVPPYEAALRGEPRSLEYVSSLDGRDYWLFVVPVEEGGRVTGGIALSQDITGRRYAERQRSLAEDSRRLMIDVMNEAYVAIDEGGRVSDWNERATRLFGFTAEEAIGRPTIELIIPPEDHREFDALIERFVRNGLDVVNRELDAEFHQERFAFVARWDEGNEWMDIGFHARDAHDVAIRKLETVASFAAGEQLRFEISAKFRRDAVVAELEAAGMSVDEWWTDRSADFALVLATRSPDEP